MIWRIPTVYEKSENIELHYYFKDKFFEANYFK